MLTTPYPPLVIKAVSYLKISAGINISISMHIYVFLCIFLYIYVYLCISMYFYVYLCISIYIYVYIYGSKLSGRESCTFCFNFLSVFMVTLSQNEPSESQTKSTHLTSTLRLASWLNLAHFTNKNL